MPLIVTPDAMRGFFTGGGGCGARGVVGVVDVVPGCVVVAPVVPVGPVGGESASAYAAAAPAMPKASRRTTSAARFTGGSLAGRAAGANPALCSQIALESSVVGEPARIP